jgi:hypothetical protein
MEATAAPLTAAAPSTLRRLTIAPLMG